MISKEIALKIYSAHNEIEKSKKLITDMKEVIDRTSESPKLKNAFGEPRGLQLGVPSGDNGHRLFDVSPSMAIKVIEQNIKDKEAELTELMALADIQLKG
jgi:hypothetical protein